MSIGLHICLFAMCVFSEPVGKKGASDTLEVELQSLGICHQSARN